MLNKFDTISQEKLFSNPYWEYFLEKYILPNGTIGDYHYICSNGSTMIIPITNDNKILLVKQYRYLNKKYSWEFPGGGVKKGNDYLKNAREELNEETGYFSGNMICLGVFNPFNGVTNEICKVYLAKCLSFVAENPELSEEFDVQCFSYDEIETMIHNNEIWDGMTIASFALFAFSKYKKEL